MGNAESTTTEPLHTVTMVNPSPSQTRDHHFYDPVAKLEVGPRDKFAVSFSRSEQDFRCLCLKHPDLEIARYTEGSHTYITFERRPQPLLFDQEVVDGQCLLRALDDAIRTEKFKEGNVFRGEASFPSGTCPLEWDRFLRVQSSFVKGVNACFYADKPDVIRFSIWLRPSASVPNLPDSLTTTTTDRKTQ